MRISWGDSGVGCWLGNKNPILELLIYACTAQTTFLSPIIKVFLNSCR